jgi:transcriptional regulator with XRE-family HTH domain
MSQGELTAIVSSNVRGFAAKNKLSQEEIAEAMTELGVPMKRHTVASICGGRRGEISVDEAAAFARVFEVDILDMLEG